MFNRRAQSTLEYAIIIAVVMAGLWMMQNYLKRGYQGKLKDAADQMGEQYDPKAITATYTITAATNVTQTNFGTAQSSVYTDQVNSKTGNESLSKWDANASVYNQ